MSWRMAGSPNQRSMTSLACGSRLNPAPVGLPDGGETFSMTTTFQPAATSLQANSARLKTEYSTSFYGRKRS